MSGATLTIYGASDDLIEVESSGQSRALSNEFNGYEHDDAEDGHYLAISDGTLLRVKYTDDGIWRITPIAYGKADYSKKEAVSARSDQYSDIVTLTLQPGGEFAWVVCGTNMADNVVRDPK